MKLKFKKKIVKRMILLDIETTNFTDEENKMLDILGEPVIKFEKLYGANKAISIDKKIRTGFKMTIRFDGTEDILMADSICDQFLEEIPEELAKAMEKVKNLYNDIDGTNENKAEEYIDIVY